MLERVISAFGAFFFIIGFALSAALFIGMMGQWYALQNQAQFIAASEGKYGGYTVEAQNSLDRFISDFKLDRSKVTVEVSAPDAPVPWGTPVWAKVTHTFTFKVGGLVLPFTIPITGVGRSVSTYLPGAYNVVYCSPT